MLKMNESFGNDYFLIILSCWNQNKLEVVPWLRENDRSLKKKHNTTTTSEILAFEQNFLEMNDWSKKIVPETKIANLII